MLCSKVGCEFRCVKECEGYWPMERQQEREKESREHWSEAKFESKTAKRELPIQAEFFFLLSTSCASNSGLERRKPYSIPPVKIPITWTTRVDVCQCLFCIIRKTRRVNFGSLCWTRPACENFSSLFISHPRISCSFTILFVEKVRAQTTSGFSGDGE